MYIDADDNANKLKEGPTITRKIIQTTASFYDNFGLFSPVSFIGKIIFQDTWCQGINKDELLPTDLATRCTLGYRV